MNIINISGEIIKHNFVRKLRMIMKEIDHSFQLIYF